MTKAPHLIAAAALFAAPSLIVPHASAQQTTAPATTSTTAGATQNGANAAGGATTTAAPATASPSDTTGTAGTGMSASTPATTATTTTTAATDTAGTYATVPAESRLSSSIVGLSVTNPQNQDVATIKDVAWGDTGQVRAYILGVGGFLGIGARYVAVQPSAVTLHWDAQNKAWKAEMNTTADALKTAPQFTYPNG